MREENWREIAKKLVELGWFYAGTCMCPDRARKYKKGIMMIKIFPNISRLKLYLRSSSMSPYEDFNKLEELVSLAQEAEMDARRKRQNH